MAETFVTSQQLRFCDTDRLGHINNGVYSAMCEAGRAELMLAAGLFDPAGGHAVVIARLELDFLREMNWPGEVIIETAIHRLGQKSFEVRQRLYQDAALVARAGSVLAVIDTTTRRAIPLAEAWRATLARWLVEDF